MAGFSPSESSYASESRCHGSFHEGSDPAHSGARWYFTRKEIEENSPSRRDVIDLKKETYLQKSYCTFLQDLGMRLKVPQVTIATAIIFCHRFFLRQSHAKNDRRTIATACMFLAGKVEETPRSLNNVILVSYEIIHKKDPTASQRIKQKEVYEQQKELILLGERVVLATLGFDLNVHHPYKPLVEAIKKFKVAQNALAQVAWNFVNDGLRTSLCLQYMPHHIAAGAIFLAAKFLKVKLPSDGEKVWWQEFDVTPRQLEDVSNQMLELYEQNRTVQAPTGSEVDGSSSNVTAYPPKTPTVNEETLSVSGRSLTGVGADVKHRGSTLSPARSLAEQPCSDNQNIPQRCAPHQSNESGSAETVSGIWDTIVDADGKDTHSFSHGRGKEIEASIKPDSHTEVCVEDVETDKAATGEVGEWRGEGSSHKSNVGTLRNAKDKESSKGHCLPVPDAIKKFDKDRLKAALEKRKRIRGNMPKKCRFDRRR